MNFFRRFSFRLLFCLTLSICFASTAQAGLLYVLNDDPAGSRIYGFQVNETTGGISLLPNFPVNTGGTGGTGLVSERLAIDPTNRRLYAINDGSDTVSAFSINASNGALTALPFSPISLGSGTWNTISVHPSGSPLLVANGATGGGVASFVITPTTATPAAGSPFPITGPTAFSGVISRDGNYYYVGGNTGNTIAGFSINPTTGVLTTLPGSPFNSGAANPLAYAMDAEGRLFAVNSNADIRAFTSANGVLTPVTGNPFPPAGLSNRRAGLIHPNGQFYMVAGNTGNHVGVYRISGSGAATTLTAVAGSPFPTGGTTANNLAINQAGTLLFVANRISRNITTFAVNPTTGALTSLNVQPSNTLGTAGSPNGIAYLAQTTRRPRGDFDADGRTDFVIFRNGTWHFNMSTFGQASFQFGQTGDSLAPADFDGDGRADIAVWRVSSDPNRAFFYILQSSNNQFRTEQFGRTGDTPIVIGDWDGDGKADPAVYRNGAAAGQQSFFYYRPSSQPGVDFVTIQWGLNGDRPLNGDFDGDGRQDAAVFRPSDGNWYIRQSSNNQLRVAQWGVASDRFVPADYDGDAKTDLAVFRPSSNTWFILNSLNNQSSATQFGQTDDILVPGDYDGDGRDDISVFRPAGGNWFRINSGNSSQAATQFGQNGDLPAPAAFLAP